MDPDEGRNAEIAREMAATGKWIVPVYNGVPYLDKPAFYFRLVALSMGALGKSELSARLPSAVFAFALLVLMWKFCRREYNERVAAIAVVALATTPLFQAFAGIVIFDMPLTFFVCAAIVSGYVAEAHQGRARARRYALGAALAGIATLVKGPVGFIIPSLVLMTFAAIERRPDHLRRMFALRNFAVFAAIVVPWFVAVSLERPDFPYYGIVKESWERFTSPSFNRGGPFYYYVPVLLGTCFAWSALFPGSALLAWRRREQWVRADRLLVAMVSSVTLFFSLSHSKLPGYVLTVVVAMAVVVARLIDRALSHPTGEAANVVRRSSLLLALTAGAATLWQTLDVGSPGSGAVFTIDSADYETLEAVFAHFAPTFFITSVVALIAFFSRNVRISFAAFLVFPLSFQALSFAGIRSYAQANSSEPLARAVAPIAAEGTTVACLECFPPGLAFYLGKRLTLITRDGAETTSNYIPFYLQTNDTWPAHIIPVSGLSTWLRGPRPSVLLIAARDQWGVLHAIARQKRRKVRILTDDWRAILLPARESRES